MKRILLSNRQKSRAMDLRALRRIIRQLLDSFPGKTDIQIAIHLVGHRQMTRLNETFLHHSGSTDVITFDYAPRPNTPILQGEIFVCVDEAVEQARRFCCAWQEEIIRYVIHGVLHLTGFDDGTPEQRRVMKRRENQLLRSILNLAPASQIEKHDKNHA